MAWGKKLSDEMCDFDRRMQFCETILEKIAADPDFVKHTCFRDEATFFLHGEENRNNARYWCPENPNVAHETHTQC